MVLNRNSSIALILLIGISGCRVGNYTESKGESPNPNTNDVADEYHSTNIEAVEYCVKLFDQTDESCVQAKVNEAPSYWTTVMLDPVRFLYDRGTGEGAVIANNNNKLGFTVAVNLNSFSFATQMVFPNLAFWREIATQTPECLATETDTINGQVYHGAASGQVNGFTVSGRLHAEITTEFHNAGDCTDQLQEMEDCLFDTAQCPSDPNYSKDELYGFAAGYFGPWIVFGPLDMGDVSEVESLSYTLSYK